MVGFFGKQDGAGKLKRGLKIYAWVECKIFHVQLAASLSQTVMFAVGGGSQAPFHHSM